MATRGPVRWLTNVAPKAEQGAAERQRVQRRGRTEVRRMLAEAADCERRAAGLTHTMATLDEERQRCLVEARLLRMQVQRIEAGQIPFGGDV